MGKPKSVLLNFVVVTMFVVTIATGVYGAVRLYSEFEAASNEDIQSAIANSSCAGKLLAGINSQAQEITKRRLGIVKDICAKVDKQID